eukprot:CAMPEP_0195040898 /NCGR_PEP_ID=MMETSP0326_2-20130528/80582_1 /TAXON_ID=2866 ORGANISM="Crypthecodinium cohnii, Strain Seligo" /NCGR_SAMPLE_ID=MMETSP0326_2 /ASSEMBLY_ACC=CAM_ASM_000348 /LENGTH=104 /DNA_ID=CAMNT_0040067855 /DNA_START=492 /DNA_END=802 /DNA_ORIENTATION=-
MTGTALPLPDHLNLQSARVYLQGPDSGAGLGGRLGRRGRGGRGRGGQAVADTLHGAIGGLRSRLCDLLHGHLEDPQAGVSPVTAGGCLKDEPYIRNFWKGDREG